MDLPTPEEVDASSDVLYDFLDQRRVVGLRDDIVVKYGMAIDLKEAETASFASRNTTIPVPTILGTYKHNSTHYIFMGRIRGRPLSESLYSLSHSEYQTIAVEMKQYMDQLDF
jgi:aminoglycoside phosphotransferase